MPNATRFIATTTLVGLALACSAGGAPDSTVGSGGLPGAAATGGSSPQPATGGASSQAGTSTAGTLSLNPTGGEATQGGSGVVDPTMACATETRDSKPLLVDVYVLIDKSVSMYCPADKTACDNSPSSTPPPTRWSAVTEAISKFVQDPASAAIGVGLGFFPLFTPVADQCLVSNYSTPLVPIAPAMTSAAAIVMQIGAQAPGGNTPTHKALAGAYGYIMSYTAQTPGHTAAVLLVTDGMPFSCGESHTTTLTLPVVQMAYSGTPSIKTYVVGMGNTAALDELALAGSGNQTHYFDANGDVSSKIQAALKSVTTSITCDYAIPTGGKPIDFGLVNIEAQVGATGTAAALGNVTSAAQCDARGGWYYDANPPATPTKITLCPQSCEPLKATDNSSVKVLYGCKTKPPA
ncbi:MAG TPA: vWA domain-containing protein [Polyangiaceae bacterium]|nr:vWA domain-containing protein [Polyangiaceae bacterium]